MARLIGRRTAHLDPQHDEQHELKGEERFRQQVLGAGEKRDIDGEEQGSRPTRSDTYATGDPTHEHHHDAVHEELDPDDDDRVATEERVAGRDQRGVARCPVYLWLARSRRRPEPAVREKGQRRHFVAGGIGCEHAPRIVMVYPRRHAHLDGEEQCDRGPMRIMGGHLIAPECLRPAGFRRGVAGSRRQMSASSGL